MHMHIHTYMFICYMIIYDLVKPFIQYSFLFYLEFGKLLKKWSDRPSANATRYWICAIYKKTIQHWFSHTTAALTKHFTWNYILWEVIHQVNKYIANDKVKQTTNINFQMESLIRMRRGMAMNCVRIKSVVSSTRFTSSVYSWRDHICHR